MKYWYTLQQTQTTFLVLLANFKPLIEDMLILNFDLILIIIPV